MHGSVERLEKWLQREVGDPQLRLKWEDRIERYVVGRQVKSLASDYIDWFLVVSDGNSGYRAIDQRLVRKIVSLDTWRRPKHLTPEEFCSQLDEAKDARIRKNEEAIKYRLKHEARYIHKAAVKDGIFDGPSKVWY